MADRARAAPRSLYSVDFNTLMVAVCGNRTATLKVVYLPYYSLVVVHSVSRSTAVQPALRAPDQSQPLANEVTSSSLLAAFTWRPNCPPVACGSAYG